MMFRVIGGVSYHILCDRIPIPFPFGKRGEQPPTIVLHDNEVCLIRDMDFHYGENTIITLSWLIDDTNKKSKVNWRDLNYQKLWIEYYTEVIKLMTSYQREVTIDGILRKEIDYQYWVC